MADPMVVYTWCAGLNMVFGGLACLLKPVPIVRLIWGAALLFWIVQAACFLLQFGTTSLGGAAPTFLFAALVLCLWQWASLKGDTEKKHLRPRLSAFFLILLSAGSLVAEPYREPSFMMGVLYAKVFFLSRPVSLGLSLFALAGSLDSLSDRHTSRAAGVLDHSKLCALLSAIVFLGGEISGCYWGFMGWGTTWRWSANFYFSAMLFVLYMVALHVPRSLFASDKAYALGFFSPLTVIVLAMTLSKMMNI